MFDVVVAGVVHGVARVPQTCEREQRDEHPPVFGAPPLVDTPGDTHAQGGNEEADTD